MKEYELKIETKNHIKRIKNPRKARDAYMIIRCIVRVMDDDGVWHFVGHCFHPTDASWAASEINEAIANKKNYINVESNLS